MKTFNYADAFASETERKEKLLDLFDKLPVSIPGKGRDRKYDRILRDHVEVTQIAEATLEVQRENGETLSPITISHDIARLLRTTDELVATFAQKGNQWLIGNVEMILSPLPGDQIH